MSRPERIARSTPIDAARVRAILAASVYFRDLPPATLDLLARISRIVRFKDAALVQAGRPVDPRFFVVVSGALRLSTPPSPGGASTTLAVTGPGGFYGAGRFLMPALVWGPSHAVGETELAVIEAPEFRGALRNDPALAPHLSAQLVRRFNALISLFGDVVGAPLPQRLARRLTAQVLTLKRVHEVVEIEVGLTQTMLAEMLGVSRSQVNAVLRKWHEAGIIRLGYRRLYLLDAVALCKIAGPDVLPY